MLLIIINDGGLLLVLFQLIFEMIMMDNSRDTYQTDYQYDNSDVSFIFKI